jgi:glycosyltransferase involved in cell wall biosynthesis
MENATPLVSIGLPIYNEKSFIAETIRSILAQTFQNFELIISDNFSTDETAFICEEFAHSDSRIIFIKQEENIGAASNFKHTFDLAKGEYFVWISGHDLWDKEFLEQSLTLMQSDANVVLCHAEAVWISTEGERLGTIGRPVETRDLDRLGRFHVTLWGMGYGSTIYGLIRTEALKRCSLGLKVIAPDNILLNELSLLGSFAHIPQPLQYIRKLDDYGSWENYIQKIFNQKLSELSGVELFGQMLSAYIDVTVKHVNSKSELNIMLLSIVNCLFTKYSWIFNALTQNNQEDFKSENRWFNFLTHLQKVSSQSSSDILQLYQENKNIDVQALPVILIDAVFFQYYQTGIARVWRSLLEQWTETQLAQHILVLDRAGTAPKIPGIRYRIIPAHNYKNTEADRAMLQEICDEEKASIFISTYYTIPESTPSVFMAYDMIPEVLESNLEQPMWREKHRAIEHASSYIAISQNTARDLCKFFPSIPTEAIVVAHCGVSQKLGLALPHETSFFKTKYGIRKPYFLLVGAGFVYSDNYKNGELFFKAFSQLANSEAYDIVCTGGNSLDSRFREYTSGSTVHSLHLTDEELRFAYAGAIALVFPSRYEGFGMPVIEAMACGCPVITCANSSIPEVAGEAAIYVNERSILEMVDALHEVQKPGKREKLIQSGLEQAKKFSWSSMAEKVSTALLEATLISLTLREINYVICPDWSQPEELIAELLEQTLVMVASSSDKEKITLIIGLEGVDAETADLLVSSVAMNLLMTADLDISEGPEVSLIDQLSDLQWQVLLPKLHKRIQLKQENQSLIDSKLNELPLLALG